MPLSVGDKLGPYEILAPLGVGGRGEVYKGSGHAARPHRRGEGVQARVHGTLRVRGPGSGGAESSPHLPAIRGGLQLFGDGVRRGLCAKGSDVITLLPTCALTWSP